MSERDPAPDPNVRLEELYARYAHRVYARCRYLLKDPEEARDAMQDVFIKAQKNLAGFREEASPLTWLTRIATNHCLNLIRAKNAAWHERYRGEVKTQVHEAPAPGAQREAEQLIALCLEGCPAELAEVAVYYFVDEMKQKDICDLVGMSAPTLRKRLREFIAFAREKLAVELPDVTFHAPPI